MVWRCLQRFCSGWQIEEDGRCAYKLGRTPLHTRANSPSSSPWLQTLHQTGPLTPPKLPRVAAKIEGTVEQERETGVTPKQDVAEKMERFGKGY
mmetsp:Transcript_27802/g.38428  ORF Transcript_27802/g.38428 Transcript_27802/m.38428 type:complete len:94 (-) Transcript_27802:437-718(-)